MNNKLIRLTESDIHKIVKESVNRVLRESEGLNAKQWLSSYKKSNGVYPERLYKYVDPDSMKNKNPLSIDYHMERLNKGLDDYKLAMLNHDHSDAGEAEVFPDLKDAQNKASWKAIDDEYGTPNGNDSTAFRDDTSYDRHVGNDLAYYANNNVYESDLHRIVKESVNKILKEGQEDYNQVMSVLNKPIWQKKLKKAWEKEKLTNPNPDWDSFEYNFAIRCLDKEREEDAKRYYKMRKYQRQLDNNTRKYV